MNLMPPSSPRILVGCPTAAPYAYCLQQWIAGVQALIHKPLDIVLADNSETEDYSRTLTSHGLRMLRYRAPPHTLPRDKLAHSRNMLRQLVLDEGHDYFFSVEQDIVPPPDALELLLRHRQPIVSGVYYKYFTLQYKGTDGKILTKKKAMPLLAHSSQDPKKMHFIPAEEVEGDHFFQVRYCGLGCLLIHRSVLEKISFRVDQGPEGLAFDDVYFCNDALAAGFSLHVDTAVKCLHLLTGKPGGLFSPSQQKS